MNQLKNKFLFIFTLLIVMSSCQFTAPSFRRLDQWTINKLSSNQITLSNQAIFYNPNQFGGLKLSGLSLDVMADNKKIGTITNLSANTTINKTSEFMIPLSLNINPADLIGSIGSIIGVISGKTIQVRCVGKVNAGFFLFNKGIAIDQTLPVSTNQIKL